MRHAGEVMREVYAESFPDTGPQPFRGAVLDGVLALYVGLAAEAALGNEAAHRAAAVRTVLKGALSLGAATVSSHS
jgi:hypothetical protein